MPCYTISVFTTDFTQAQGHEDLLADALRDLGYTVARSGKGIYFSGQGVSGSYVDGRFQTSGTLDAEKVKQAFGHRVVKEASRRYGWQVKSLGGNKLRIHKRA